MNDQRTDLSDAVYKQLQAAVEFSRAGAEIDALCLIEQIFEQGLRSRALYESAARAAVVAILDSRLAAAWTRTRRNALYRHLILQPERFGTCPIFHHELASSRSSGNDGALEKAAAELAPTIALLWREGCRERYLLIMVLLLRESLRSHRAAAGMDEAAISAWHLELLPEFDRDDMAIPYNMMFDRTGFARNIEDLRRAIGDMSPQGLAKRFGSWKLVMIHWVTGGARIDRDIVALVDALPETEGDDAAGKRSLALRAAAAGHGSPSVFVRGGQELCASPVAPDPAGSRRAIARLESRNWQIVQGAARLLQSKAPFLRLPGRQPRVAVCISGQLRGYGRAYRTWLASLLRGAETHFFVHSWIRIGRSGAEPFRAYLPFAGERFCAAWRHHAHQAGMTEMQQRYPLLFGALNDTGVVTQAALAGFYGTDDVVLEDDSAPRFDGWSNSKKMHYKLAAAEELARMAGEDCDLMLRIRPDKQVGLAAFRWGDLLSATRSASVLFADAPFGYQYGVPMVGDQVAIGAPSAMRTYSQTFNLVPRLVEEGVFGCSPDFAGHSSLAATLWHAGVDVRRLPARMGSLLEADPLSNRTTLECLEADAQGRMDHVDRALIQEITSDLASA